MRLLPASLAVRICGVAAAAAMAVAGGTTAADAAVHGSASHPQHQASHAAKKGDQQRPKASASATPSAASSAPTASPSPAIVKVQTALSIGVTRQVARKHQITAVIDGRLFEPAASDHGVRGKIVWLLRRGAGGQWIVAGHEFTGPRGGVAFRVHVRHTATFRLAFRGTANFTPALSTALTVP